MTTPTAALVEEAETMAVRALDGTASREEKSALFAILAAALRRTEAELDAATTQLAKKFKRLEELERRCTQAESERNELRATVTRLNRRAQTAEAGVRDNVEASKAAGKSMGRTLANAAADMYRRRAEKAEAERDEARREAEGWIKALHDEVAVRTREEKAAIEEAAKRAQAEAERDAQHAEVLRLTGERDEAREALAQKHLSERQSVRYVIARRDGRISELTATRDLLTEENARLQKEYQHLADQFAVLDWSSAAAGRRTLELLLRGGK